MNEEWILQTKETRRKFSTSTWIPLRASQDSERKNVKEIGYVKEYFGCGSVAFPPEQRKLVEDNLGWSDIGIGHNVAPYAYDDGYYASVDQFQYNDKEPIGVNLVFDQTQYVVGGTHWILNPDLVIALHLIKEGTNWVRPEENFVVVAREVINDNGEHKLIEIKREFLIDYLAARGLSLRLSCYRQRVENVALLENSDYRELIEHEEKRDGGDFKFRTRSINQVFGGSWSVFRAWRTDIDEDEDAPVMGPETANNTGHEKSEGRSGDYEGIRVEGDFWRDEWVEHQSQSIRVRGDRDTNLPQFIVDTDGKRMNSSALDDEDVGRWLWFRPSVVNELLANRGFSFEWYTAETGGIRSTSGYKIHFGINSSDLINVYAYDVAKLSSWEQHIWVAHNVAPEGGVSRELLSSHVKAQVADTYAVEFLLFESMRLLEAGFLKKYQISLFNNDISDLDAMQIVSRFASKDQASLLRLAKEIVRVFSDRLNIHELRKIATADNKKDLASNKILQDILSQKIGADKARKVFSVIVGAYDMRVGDAHPTGSKVQDSIKLAGIDQSHSFLKQGEQLINNFGQSVWFIGKFLFGENEYDED